MRTSSCKVAALLVLSFGGSVVEAERRRAQSIQHVLVASSSAARSAASAERAERAAELHPYTVSALDSRRAYACSGLALDERRALTVEQCARRRPAYLAVAVAVLTPAAARRALAVADVLLPPDDRDVALAALPCDRLAVLLARLPRLELYAPRAPLAPPAAPLPVGEIVKLVGFGCGGGEGRVRAMHALRYRIERCAARSPPRCACAAEVTRAPADDGDVAVGSVAWGGPVVVRGGLVVALAALPSGVNGTGNVFVMLEPFLAWIEDLAKSSPAMALRSRTLDSNGAAPPPQYSSIPFIWPFFAYANYIL